MKKAEIEKRTEELLTPIAKEHGCSVYDVEYVKESGEYYLNCYIDKEGGVTINDCVDVNRPLSDALDEADFMDEAYTLIVSSPGLGRTLTKDRHLEASVGMSVDIKLYKAVDKVKVFTGTLISFDKETVTIGTEDGERTFVRKDIAKINLTLDL